MGSKGDDVLIGGRGADVFKTSKGVDIVNDFSLMQGDRIGLYQDTIYDVIDDVDGTLIRVTNSIRMLLVDQDYDDFLAAGNDAIARILFDYGQNINPIARLVEENQIIRTRSK